MYGEVLGWLQGSGLGELARRAGWAYAVVNSAHVIGAALVLGSIAVFDCLLLARRDEEAAAAARAAVPLAALGLAIQLATGLFLLAADARTTGTNPAFLTKVALIGLGLLNAAALHRRYGAPWRPRGGGGAGRGFAAVSLLAWLGAVVAGRLIAYV